MKKLSFILLIITLVIVSASCGNAENSTPSSADQANASASGIAPSGQGALSTTETSTPSQTSTSSQTSSSSSASTSSEMANPILIGKENIADYPIPVFAYDEPSVYGAFIYVKRDAFIDYINRGEHGDYFPMRELEEMMMVPYYYYQAGLFDSNGLAIVQLEETKDEMMRIRSFLIDGKGVPVTNTDRFYTYIEKIGNRYLCHFTENLEVPDSTDILDENARLLKTIKETGYAYRSSEHYPNIVTFPVQDKMFNLDTMDYVTSIPDDSQNVMYSTMRAIGGGYFAVSDFSEYDEGFQKALHDMPLTAYKKAIYKDGVLLSGYDFFIVNHVKDDVFFVYDGKEYYFYDVKRAGKVFPSLTNLCIGNYTFDYYPGLLIGYNLEEYVYLTEKNMAKNHPVYQFDDEVSFYYRGTNYIPSYSLYPQILLKDAEVAEKINTGIMMDVGAVYPDEIETEYTLFPYSSSNVIQIDRTGPIFCTRQMIHDNIHTTGDSNFHLFNSYYDLKTGKKFTLEDWFQDQDLAMAILIANASMKYRELYPNAPDPINPEEFFQTYLWHQYISFNAHGFWIIVPINSDGNTLEFSASMEDLKLILKPEIYQLIQ